MSTLFVAATVWITSLVAMTATFGQRSTGNAVKTTPLVYRDQENHLLSNGGCPRVCFCNTPSGIVYCSRRGLGAIPGDIGVDSLQLNLNGNSFDSTTIVRQNLSRYVNLEHLYLSECGLETIQVDAFVDLVNLRWLDLSNNRIRSIEPYTFNGLTLQHLFLNGNRNIRLESNSFAGLQTVGLYLHDCSLSGIEPATLGQLNSTLKSLWLNGNELDRVDVGFRQLFAVLMHLRLGSNPFRCDCNSVWLKQFYDRETELFKGAVPPTCLTPTTLKGRHFNQMTVNDFRCQAPMFHHVDAKFDVDRGTGRLSCTATGEPAPVLYWIQPSGRATKYSPASHPSTVSANAPAPAVRSGGGGELNDDQPGLSEAVLEVDMASVDQLSSGSPATSATSGMYICVADNEAGNVTLTVSLPKPKTESRKVESLSAVMTSSTGQQTVSIRQQMSHNASPTRLSILSPDDAPQSETDENEAVDLFPPETETNDVSRDRDRDRMFTVSELTWAVVGTHVITLALCILLAIGLCWRARYHGNDSDDDNNMKDVYSFDAEYERRLDCSGSNRRQGDSCRTGCVQNGSMLASIHQGNRDHDYWVKTLLSDYRCQQKVLYSPRSLYCTSSTYRPNSASTMNATRLAR